MPQLLALPTKDIASMTEDELTLELLPSFPATRPAKRATSIIDTMAAMAPELAAMLASQPQQSQGRKIPTKRI